MTARIPVIAIAGVLAGFALAGCSPFYATGCQYGVMRQSQPERCMTYAEYEAARGKPRGSEDLGDYKAAREKEQHSQPDSRYGEWIP